MNFFDANASNTVYYIAAIIFLIIVYMIHRLEKRDRRIIQLEIEKMLELDIMPKRKGDERLREEFEMRKSLRV